MTPVIPVAPQPLLQVADGDVVPEEGRIEFINTRLHPDLHVVRTGITAQLVEVVEDDETVCIRDRFASVFSEGQI